MKSLFHLFSIGQSCISHLTFAMRLVIQKSHSHINRSLGNWMRVASARAPLDQRCPSVILKAEEFLRNAHIHRDRLALVASRLKTIASAGKNPEEVGKMSRSPSAPGKGEQTAR